jgi:CHAT domain-containing protein
LYGVAAFAQPAGPQDSLSRLKELNAKVDELRKDPAQSVAALAFATQAVDEGKSANPGSIEYAYAIRNLLLLKGRSPLPFHYGADADAVSLARQSVAIAESVFGEDHVETMPYLQLLAGTLRARDSFPLYQRVIEVRTRVLGLQHPDTRNACFEYAAALETEGDRLSDRDQLTQAAESFEAAVRMYDQFPGSAVVSSELARTRVALLLEKIGEFSRALQTQQQILANRQKRNAGKTLIATSLAAVAQLQSKLHNPGAAADFYEQALALIGKTGPQLLVVEWLSSSAELRHKMGDQQRALELAAEAGDTIAQLTYDSATLRALPMISLAKVYEALEDPVKALEWARRALALVDPPGTSSINRKTAIGILGVAARLTRNTGDFAAAADLYGRAQEMQAEVYGAATLTSVRYLSEKGISLMAAGDNKPGCAALRRAMRFHSQLIADVVATGSDQHLRLYTATGTRVLNASLECASGASSSFSVEEVYDYSLRLRSMVTDEFRLVLEAVRSRADVPTIALLNDFIEKSYAVAALEKTEPEAGAAAYRSKLNELRSALSESRAKLVAGSSQFREAVAEVTSRQLSHLLPPGSALVEMLDYTPMERKPGNPFGGDIRYGAFLLRSGEGPRWIDLGPDKLIFDLYNTLRRSLPDVANRSLYSRLARELYKLLISPLSAGWGAGIAQVYLVPYGALQAMPWAALIGPDDRYLPEEKFQLDLLGSSRDLVTLSNLNGVTAGPDVIVVAPAYGPGKRYRPLIGTIDEGAAIAKLLRRPVVLQGAEANRDRVLSLKSPRILHLATHGEYRLGREDVNNAIGIVALAGANTVPGGVVTDRELAGVDLRGTQLVTLSACDTGRGIGSFADGLFGFPRALAIAGSRSQLLSLWTVSDSATRQFMEYFYTHLAAGKAKAEALRQVQRDFHAQGRPPGEWAAFTLFGDPGPLDAP